VFLRFLRVLTRPLTTPDFSSQLPALNFQRPVRTSAISAAPGVNAAVAHISKIWFWSSSALSSLSALPA